MDLVLFVKQCKAELITLNQLKEFTHLGHLEEQHLFLASAIVSVATSFKVLSYSHIVTQTETLVQVLNVAPI